MFTSSRDDLKAEAMFCAGGCLLLGLLLPLLQPVGAITAGVLGPPAVLVGPMAVLGAALAFAVFAGQEGSPSWKAALGFGAGALAAGLLVAPSCSPGLAGHFLVGIGGGAGLAWMIPARPGGRLLAAVLAAPLIAAALHLQGPVVLGGG